MNLYNPSLIDLFSFDDINTLIEQDKKFNLIIKDKNKYDNYSSFEKDFKKKIFYKKINLYNVDSITKNAKLKTDLFKNIIFKIPSPADLKVIFILVLDVLKPLDSKEDEKNIQDVIHSFLFNINDSKISFTQQSLGIFLCQILIQFFCFNKRIDYESYIISILYITRLNLPSNVFIQALSDLFS